MQRSTEEVRPGCEIQQAVLLVLAGAPCHQFELNDFPLELAEPFSLRPVHAWLQDGDVSGISFEMYCFCANTAACGGNT